MAAIPPGAASVFSLVFCHGSQYAITVSPISISWPHSNDLWHSSVHWSLALTFNSSLGSRLCNLSMKSTFTPGKSKKERTYAADCRGPAAFRAATLSESGDIPSLQNTFPKNVTAQRWSLLFIRLNASLYSCATTLQTSSLKISAMLLTLKCSLLNVVSFLLSSASSSCMYSSFMSK